MRKYSIVAVIWEDHSDFYRTQMVKNPEDRIIPTLTVGLLYKETPKSLTVVSDIERYEDHDDSSYCVIHKAAVLSMKKYGRIKLERLREG